MKTKILMIVVLVLSAVMMTTGAFAYFTTENRSVAGNIKSGSVDLLIAGVDPATDCPTSGYGTTAELWKADNMAPGDFVSARICMMNTGSLDIAQVVFNWANVNPDLAKNLFVTQIANSRTAESVADYMAYDDNNDLKLSLAELFDGAGGTVDEYWVGGIPVFLPTSAPVQWVQYTFQFNPGATNELQKLDFNYTLTITGLQHPAY